EWREKRRRNRLEKRHFRALRARQTSSLPLLAPPNTVDRNRAETLTRKAVQSTERVGIAESKWKFRITCLRGSGANRHRRHDHWLESWSTQAGLQTVSGRQLRRAMCPGWLRRG